jgi:hypothetical protein
MPAAAASVVGSGRLAVARCWWQQCNNATMQQCNTATHEYNTAMRLHASNRNCASGVAVLTVRRSISASLLGRCGSKRSGAALLHEPPMRAGMSSAARRSLHAAHC